MDKLELWTPTTGEYYQRLNALSPNYDWSDFELNADNIWVNIKPSFNPGQLDSLFMTDTVNNKQKFTPGSEATERVENHPTSDMARFAYESRVHMGSRNLNLSFDVSEEKIDLGTVILYKYEAQNSGLAKKPAFIYYHGGDFYGGSAKNAKNLCKELADLCHGIVFDVDYRLTPEVAATELLADCRKAVEYAHENADALNIDSEKIFVAGDSAGGNLAAVMSYVDRKEKTNYINGQVLIYPMVDNQQQPVTQDLSSMPDEQKEIVAAMDNGNINSLACLKEVYADDANSMDGKTISPNAMTDEEFKEMPRTMVIAAGYDCLNVQGYTYAYHVAEHRNDTTYLMYGGMIHAFIDKLGILPQAEDAVRQMALWVNQPEA